MEFREWSNASCSSVLRVFGILLYLSLLCCIKACLSSDVIVAHCLCSGVSVLLLNRYNSLFLLSLSSLSILQNITDSIDLHTELYLNYLPLRLTTVTDCARCHVFVNPTILYHVCVNNKRLSALYNLRRLFLVA